VDIRSGQRFAAPDGYRLDQAATHSLLTGSPASAAFRLADRRPVLLWTAQPPASAAAARKLGGELAKLATLSGHPHLATVLDHGRLPDGGGFLVTVAANTLAGRLADRGPMPVHDVARVVAEAADGLEALHAGGFCHGAVTPAALLTDRHGVVVAPPVRGDSPAGPPADAPYRAPEVVSGEDPTPAADVYGLAATAYALLTGRPPHGTEGDLMLRILTAAVPDLPASVAGGTAVPPELNAALQRGLARDPGQRPAGPRALADLVTRAVSGAHPIGVAAPPPPSPPARNVPPVGEQTAVPPVERQSTLSPTAPAPEAGARPLGSGYLLDAPIGEGAAGKVWRGRRRSDGEPVAVKELRPELSADTEAVNRFLRERATLVALRHPNLIRVYDLVVEGSTLAIVMELSDGLDLRRSMRSGLRPVEALTVLAQTSAALAAVHAAGVIHRDVKPENILLERTGGQLTARLTDFGVARAADSALVTKTNQIVGTPAYIAPELVAGRPVSAASDVYGVGVMAYELLAGRRPFSADSTADLLHAHVLGLAERPHDMPERVWRVISACLAKEPALRPSAGMLADAFAALVEGRDPTTDGTSPWAAPTPGPQPAAQEPPARPADPAPMSPAPMSPAPMSPAPMSPAAVSPPPAAPMSPASPLPTTGATLPPPPAPPAGGDHEPNRRRRRLVIAGIVGLCVLVGAATGIYVGQPDEKRPPAAHDKAEQEPQIVALQVAAQSPEPGVVTLTFADGRGYAGFVGYSLWVDGSVAQNENVQSSPHEFRTNSEDEHCYQVFALVTKPPPSGPAAKPACLVADGKGAQ
jgi:serine/threonine protein kinase